jgi:DNA-binding protein YbaB
MNTPPGSRLERVLADFAEQYGALTRAREQMRALSVTARSRDGVVEVTVGADGRAAGIRFVDKRFREMTAPRLGDSVLEALTTARAEVTARATAVMTAANLRLSPSGEPVPWDEQVPSEAVLDAPSVCWRRLVREARALACGPVPVRDTGVVKAGGTVGSWEAGTGVLDTPRSRPQGPLWGRSRPALRSASPHAPLPAELREAVMALRDSVCDAVSDSCASAVCGCVGALEQPGRGATAESA